MKLFRVGATFLLACVMMACGSQSGDTKTRDDTAPVADPLAANVDEAGAAVPAYNLGDVEVNTRVVVQVAKKSLTPTVQYEELGTLREPVAVANATVKQPYPAEFWINSGIESRSAYRPQDTVYLKMEVTAEGTKEPLIVKTYVVSNNDIQRKMQMIEFNLMDYLNPLPKSVLLQTMLTIVWFPDTPPLAINVENPDLSKGQMQQKLSNTLRINFE